MAFINPKRMATYTLTPTGASIAEDESNVGQQMLKKMGWAPETGIGKNRNGIVEPVKRSALKPSTEDLPKRKRARFTPTSDEGRGEKPSFAGATPELPHDDSDDKEIPRSSKPTVFEAEPHESDSDEPPTEAPVEIKEEPTRQRSAAFSTSNVHSLPGYPFY
ncbi:hypothetical protein ECG_04369 [Echinococcus granulosus]|uniref:D111 G patch n=1 Tax=Echinococcus granulosus TaxID=6210 RepID=A0A068WBB3_ECHGR|nr:hypothetical protein ECG_04369 [Echinococcus granulosus]CDS17349.1 D111 G patch [Echinococcus granulosus]